MKHLSKSQLSCNMAALSSVLASRSPETVEALRDRSHMDLLLSRIHASPEVSTSMSTNTAACSASVCSGDRPYTTTRSSELKVVIIAVRAAMQSAEKETVCS